MLIIWICAIALSTPLGIYVIVVPFPVLLRRNGTIVVERVSLQYHCQYGQYHYLKDWTQLVDWQNLVCTCRLATMMKLIKCVQLIARRSALLSNK